MAVNTDIKDSKLKISLEAGLNDKGEEIVKTKTFSNLIPTSDNEDVYDVAETLSSLQSLPLLQVARVDETVIFRG